MSATLQPYRVRPAHERACASLDGRSISRRPCSASGSCSCGSSPCRRSTSSRTSCRRRARSPRRSSTTSSLVKDAAFVSGKNALVGLIAGTLLGVAIGVRADAVPASSTSWRRRWRSRSTRSRSSCSCRCSCNMYPATSEMPRRLMVTLIVFFIVLVNVAKGLRQVHPIHVELMRSYAASPVQVLRKARIPNAVPYLFTALKIAAPDVGHHRLRGRVLRRQPERSRAAASRRTWRSPATPWHGRTCSAPAWSV